MEFQRKYKIVIRLIGEIAVLIPNKLNILPSHDKKISIKRDCLNISTIYKNIKFNVKPNIWKKNYMILFIRAIIKKFHENINIYI